MSHVPTVLHCVAGHVYSVLQSVAVCCSVLQCAAHVLGAWAVSRAYSVLQCVVVCCSVLQCTATGFTFSRSKWACRCGLWVVSIYCIHVYIAHHECMYILVQ